ncbi:efflux RND transporter periplasmic adaptor subunit [Anaeromyxobacter paludicola]|uniref:RND transporter n=1 Tax=Anaeromyxobacter paludicola TaxID=2918171 RepID=A0ABM7XBC8_9BACT|nr:efflux RND transporter periplasmic adaptor subunit [Anaeromyxobacter paludicola]BDG09121.1 RND transporter [Anaeromyxobacter paludicola]
MTTRTTSIGLVALLLAGCGRHAPPPAPPPAVRVQVVAPATGGGAGGRWSGVVQPSSLVPLSFRVPGYVAELLQVRAGGRGRAVAEGDRVRKGEVLARLRDAEFRDKVAQAAGQAAAAAAAAEKARLDFERATRLGATHSVTRPELEAARAQRDATRAQRDAAEGALSEARLALRDTALAAPLDGDVVRKAVEPGALVGPGTLAFAVAQVSTVKVVVGVPDVVLRTIAPGQPVTVTSDALPGRRLDARVSRVPSAADPVTRNFEIEVEIPNPDRLWKPGMVAAVELAGPAAPARVAPLLPFSAFTEAAGERGRFAVVVVEGDGAAATARLRPVTLGEVTGNQVAVVSGLAAGERVVVTGAPLLADGQRVEVVP